MADRPVGYLAVIGAPAQMSERERITATRGAVACALELAKERAVAEAESRLRGDFLDELLAGRIEEGDLVLERARKLGCDLSLPHVALVLESEGGDSQDQVGDFFGELLHSLIGAERSNGYPLARVRNRRLTMLHPLPAGGPDELAHAVKRAVDELKATWPATVSAGIGRHHPGLEGLRTSQQEAEQALAIGRSLFGPGSALAFSDLGAYRLLFLLHGSPELSSFYREVLGQLVDYDAKNHTELVRTLETYFACQANLQKTAEALYLHRNSLAYRLRRIQELTNLDLDDLEDRFLLQLALKVKRIL